MSTWMKHPRLPEDQLIEVLDEAVAAHHRAGWEVTDPPPPEPTAAELEAAAEAASAPRSPDDTDEAAVDERRSEPITTPDGAKE